MNEENKFEKAQVSANKFLNISKTLVCRLTLLLLGCYFTYFMGCGVNNSYYSLFVFSLIILLDLTYICIFNGGVDFKWQAKFRRFLFFFF